MTLRRASGDEIDVLCSAAVYRDTDGGIVGILAAAREVTEERRARRELAEQRDRLQLGPRIGATGAVGLERADR